MTLRAAVHGWYKGGPDPLNYPACLRLSAPAVSRLRYRFPLYVSRVLEMIPDRLNHPQWLARCRFTGFEPVQRARSLGRPIVLAFAHFGGYRLLRPWLRAAGIPAAVLVAEPIVSRSRLLQRADQQALLPEVPLVFDGTQIAAAVRFLAAGNCLGVALDVPTGRQTTVPVAPDWEIQLATGPIRMARRQKAELFPCSVIHESGWRYRIEFGEPTPTELLNDPSDLPAARHLLRQFLPVWEQHPDQWTADLSRCFRRQSPPAKPAHPPNTR